MYGYMYIYMKGIYIYVYIYGYICIYTKTHTMYTDMIMHMVIDIRVDIELLRPQVVMHSVAAVGVSWVDQALQGLCFRGRRSWWVSGSGAHTYDDDYVELQISSIRLGDVSIVGVPTQWSIFRSSEIL